MKKYTMLLGVCILCGCTTVGAINKSYSQVNIKDGIDEKEAVAIAQDYCLKDEECKGRVRLSTPEIRYGKNDWEVTFASKDLDRIDYAYLVHVNEKTGKPSMDTLPDKF